MTVKILYRYDSSSYIHNIYDIKLYKYEILSNTKCGYWINADSKKRWVSATGKKRFAYPTEEEALTSFIARQRRRIIYCKRDLEKAEILLSIALQKEDTE